MDPYHNLPDELIIEQALVLGLSDIAELSQTSIRFNRICKSNEFWRRKYAQDFGTSEWKSMYEARHQTVKANNILFNDEIATTSFGYDLGKSGNVSPLGLLHGCNINYVYLIIGYTECETKTADKLKALVNFVIWNYDPFDDSAFDRFSKVKSDADLAIVLNEIVNMNGKFSLDSVDPATLSPSRWNAIKHCFE